MSQLLDRIAAGLDRWKWVARLLLVFTAGPMVLVVLALCPTTVIPPAEVSEPVTVLLLDHGATASLVLPTPDGGAVRYAYGDWDYYALGNRDLTDALVALFWPTQGALGRRELPGPVDAETIRRQVGVGIEYIHPLQVDRRNGDRLLDRLDEAYQARRETEVVSPINDLNFVHHPQDYTYFVNSNHFVAGCLRDLGCTLHGPAYYSRWDVFKP